jgi:hypothetical protein
MGMAMGTSEAVGYVDRKGNVLGWFNELAFAPVDLSEHAMMDEWSFDIGVGCKYFSQDAVIKLAPAAGIELDENLTPAEKLKVVQGLMEQGDPRAVKIYESIGDTQYADNDCSCRNYFLFHILIWVILTFTVCFGRCIYFIIFPTCFSNRILIPFIMICRHIFDIDNTAVNIFFIFLYLPRLFLYFHEASV